MTNLNFTKSDDTLVAEFSATGDFNLHIECDKEFNIKVEQKTSGSNFVNTITLNSDNCKIDNDFGGLVYPKQIKLTLSKFNTGNAGQFTSKDTITVKEAILKFNN